MSVLFSFEHCSLISHEHFINRIYDEVTASDGEAFALKIKPDLFELNVPYRFKAPDEVQTQKRQRKIINKTKIAVAEEHRQEYELVLYFTYSICQILHIFSFKLIIWKLIV